jgi:hypothetical protein
MMKSFIVIFLHAVLTQAHAEDSMEKSTDSLVDKLVNKLLGSQLAIPRTGTNFLSPLSTSMRQVQAVQSNLRTFGIDSSPLEKFALTAIDVNNRGNRDLSLKAQRAELASGWQTVDDSTKASLKKVIDEVATKEGRESILAGISPGPLGYFDPLGFVTSCSAGKLLFYREVELKHGRVAMLAALGMMVGENFHPLFGGDIDVPAAFAFQQTPLQAFWPAVVAAIAIPEILSIQTFQDPTQKGYSEYWTMKTDHVPGDLGFDPLGLKPKDPSKLKAMQTKELQNGRLAMIAAAGMIAQEVATGQKLSNVFGSEINHVLAHADTFFGTPPNGYDLLR